MEFLFIKQVGISLGLGLLVGLQREWGPSHVAGIRTFALITVFGTLCARLSQEFGGWILGAGLLGLSALIIAGGIAKFKHEDITPGLTTAAAALLMYAVGALTVVHLSAAAIVGGTTAVLLHWKKQMHSLVNRFDEKDLRAIIQLVLISLVILPLLPDRYYGPHDVINPFHIWLIVVLIVGISVAGYIIARFWKTTAGTLMAGVFGGIISSTAATVSYSRQSKQDKQNASRAAFVILVASTIVFLRVAFEIGVIAPEILLQILPQLTAMTLMMTASSALHYLFFLKKASPVKTVAEKDPSNLKAAVVFGLLYAVVLFVIAATKAEFGDAGLYWVAVLSGLTDMDAITLSTTQMIQQDRIPFETGWRMIIIGAMANMVFKGAIAALLGHRRLTLHLTLFFGLVISGGICMVLFWPETPMLPLPLGEGRGGGE
jgi:uncharacterized membrane protein (DUF4010 family)